MISRLFSRFHTHYLSVLISILIIILSTFKLSGCQQNTVPISRIGFAFDTVITITIYDDTKQEALNHCIELCNFYDNLLNPSKENSDIWNINHSGGTPIKVNNETAALIQLALDYCQESQGIIDLTVYPVSSLWNFSGQLETHTDNADYYVPTDSDIIPLLSHIDYRNVEVSENVITLKDSQAGIDLGFLAKGYIADKLKEYLISQNVKSGIIDLGGNVLTIGSKPDNSDYRIGIKKPFGNTNEYITTVSISDKSVVSSGCYERYFEQEGNFYHHILDTTTGFPVKSDLLGVTIISNSSAQGDFLSTYCYILGFEKAKAYIEQLDDISAIFITDESEVITIN